MSAFGRNLGRVLIKLVLELWFTAKFMSILMRLKCGEVANYVAHLDFMCLRLFISQTYIVLYSHKIGTR